MKIMERISIADPEELDFCEEFKAELFSVLSDHGFQFQDFDDEMIVLDSAYDAEYNPERFNYIKDFVESQKWDVEVSRTIWPIFDKNDYKQAPLWVVYFKDHWISEIDFSKKCDLCGKKQANVDESVRVEKVKSKKPLLAVNGQFRIVFAEVRSAILDNLQGARFASFDEEKRYFYLGSECDLGTKVLKDNEVVGYAGKNCPQCRFPEFQIYFGPRRYSKSRWSGDDIVQESFYNGLLFTPKAFKLLKTFDRSLSPSSIALLE